MWTSDSRSIRFAAGVGGDAHLFEVALQSKTTRQVTSGSRHLGAFSTSKDGSLMAYFANDVTHPSEAFVARSDGSGEQRLTSFNDTWLAQADLVPAERLLWNVSSGTQIENAMALAIRPDISDQ